jgi:dipeptidyl aminopeptidase/acylaminoacyl peptidase
VKLDGTGLSRLTPDDGVHNVSLDATAKFFTDDWSSLTKPRTVVLRSADGKLVREMASTGTDRLTQLGLEPPELLTLKAADGTTDINGVLFKPVGFDPSKKYPVIVQVYGGPHSKQVHNTWETTDLRARVAQLGFLVAEFDGRGTPQRGKKFGAGNYLKLGQTDIDDQAAAVRQLGRRSYVDSTRVGITGISHGGYNTLMAVLRYPDVFQVGVADRTADRPAQWSPPVQPAGTCGPPRQIPRDMPRAIQSRSLRPSRAVCSSSTAPTTGTPC